MNQNQQITTTITDIETKQDKNLNPYFKITVPFATESCYFYAFTYNLPENTLQTLTESPHKLVNQLVLINYEEIPNKEGEGNFLRVKEIELLKEGF